MTMWINPETIIQSEINRSQEDKYCVIPLIEEIYRQTHRILSIMSAYVLPTFQWDCLFFK